MYADRALSSDFNAAMAELNKAVWKVADVVVPRNPKTGYADARQLIHAVIAHAVRPQETATIRGGTISGKSASGRRKSAS